MKVFIIVAVSLDGYIGVDDSHKSTDWTSKEDLKFFIEKTKEAGTVIMGRKTFSTINRALSDRRLIVYTNRNDLDKMTGVEFTSESPLDLVTKLKSEGVKQVAVCGGSSIYTQFLKSGVVDELYITIMPKLFGSGVKFLNEVINLDMKLISSSVLGDGSSILLNYKIIK
jgi:dihydrofolate reductase